MTDHNGHTPDQQRFLLACLAAHLRRNTADGALSLSDADVRAAYGSGLEFQVRRDVKTGTVRVGLADQTTSARGASG